MVVFENGKNWLTVNKPAGLPVFPLHKDPGSDCVAARLMAERPEQHQPFPQGFTAGIAHRLDVPTSGLLLVAATPKDLKRIRGYFKNGSWEKHYVFLSHSRSVWERKTCSAAIAHHPKNRRKMVVKKGSHTYHRGKWYPAETVFEHVGEWELGGVYRATMRTGVMHQIRVHASALGIPLTGDLLYGGQSKPRWFKADFALHHRGMSCSFLQPEMVEPPFWWPRMDSI